MMGSSRDKVSYYVPNCGFPEKSLIFVIASYWAPECKARIYNSASPFEISATMKSSLNAMESAGMVYVKTLSGLEPRWAKEPSLADIKVTIESISKDFQNVNVTLLAQGAFNKVHRIDHGDSTACLRVSLSVLPHSKTQSEVATLRFIREYGRIPVPTVLAFDDSNDNPIGFEWILMDLMPGLSLGEEWVHTTGEAEEARVSQIAQHSAAMFGRQFRLIGNLFPCFHSPDPFELHRLESLEVLSIRDVRQESHWGPFRNSKDWLAARLDLKECGSQAILQKKEGYNEVADAERTLEIIDRLLTLLPMYFPNSEVEQTMLFHDDLNANNILVDKEGNLTAVVDWECVSTLPLWKACQFPAFLEGKPRDEVSLIREYLKEGVREPGNLFWEHTKEFELTRLRDRFLKTMKELEPAWIEVYNSSRDQRDFDLAVQNCDNPFCLGPIQRWFDGIDYYMSGHSRSIRSLADRLQELYEHCPSANPHPKWTK